MKKDLQQTNNINQAIKDPDGLNRRLTELETTEARYQRTVDALQKSEEKYRILLDESSDPIYTLHDDGLFHYVNKAYAEAVQKKPEEIIGKKIWDVFPSDIAERRFAPIRWVFDNNDTKVIEGRVSDDDLERYFITTLKPILDDQGKVISVICISKDITDRKRKEQQLQYLGTHDILTGLFNRNFFEVEMARLQPSRLFPISIVIADLDDLKTINDRFGHPAGDELLRKAARVMQQSFRTEDIAARIGGDEFAILLPQTDEENAKAAVTRLRNNLERQQNGMLTLSIGMATGEEGGSLLETMRLADDRMYKDKANHKEDKK